VQRCRKVTRLFKTLITDRELDPVELFRRPARSIATAHMGPRVSSQRSRHQNKDMGIQDVQQVLVRYYLDDRNDRNCAVRAVYWTISWIEQRHPSFQVRRGLGCLFRRFLVGRRLCYSLGRGVLHKVASGVLQVQLMTVPLSSICAAFGDKHRSSSAPVSRRRENQPTCANRSVAGRNKTAENSWDLVD
jgi:hypothetical protein